MISGQCLCGGVRYSISGPPIRMVYCHCSLCRRSSGSSFGTSAVCRASDFSVVCGPELLTSFESSPGYRRWFCSRCGSGLYGTMEEAPELVSVRCGTLDSDPLIRPTVHIHVADRAPWVEISDALERFDGPVDPAEMSRIYHWEK